MVMDSKNIYRAASVLLEEYGVEVSYDRAYSGRGMYGETTPAITCDSGCMVGWAIMVVAEDFGLDLREARRYLPQRSDNMGLSTVWY